jgi:hypothetical protein
MNSSIESIVKSYPKSMVQVMDLVVHSAWKLTITSSAAVEFLQRIRTPIGLLPTRFTGISVSPIRMNKTKFCHVPFLLLPANYILLLANFTGSSLPREISFSS